MRLNMFDDQPPKENKSLKIVSNNKNLTKNQLQFNRLTKKIESLERNIIRIENEHEELLTNYSREVIPVRTKVAKKYIAFSMLIGEKSSKFKFTKKQLSDIKEFILRLCNTAFEHVEPTEKEEEFYNEWSDVSYHEEIESQEEDEKNFFFDMMNEMFDMDIDKDMDLENEEELDELKKKIEEKFGQNNQTKQHTKNRKKTKKQIERELEKKAEEKLKNKSIKNIYFSLAKLLHPDTEIDEEQKIIKEELMKKVTVAYKEKDLSTLLKLEMEWIHNQNEHLDKLTDDKLKLYNAALKEQVTELEQKKFSIKYNPRYRPINHLFNGSFKKAKKQLEIEAAQEKELLYNIISNYSFIYEKPLKKNIVDIVEILLADFHENDFDMVFDDFLY